MWLCQERPHLLYKSLAFTKSLFSCLSLTENSPLSEADLTSITYVFITFLLTIVMWYSWAQSLQFLWSASWFRVLLCVMPAALAATSWIWSFYVDFLQNTKLRCIFLIFRVPALWGSACVRGCRKLQRESCGCLPCFLAHWSPLEWKLYIAERSPGLVSPERLVPLGLRTFLVGICCTWKMNHVDFWSIMDFGTKGSDCVFTCQSGVTFLLCKNVCCCGQPF